MEIAPRLNLLSRLSQVEPIPLLLAGGAFLCGLFPIGRVYLWDEAVYLSVAENLFAAKPYYTEIAFRPPLLPVLLNMGSHLMSIDLFAHLLTAAFFAAGVLVVYLLGCKLHGNLAGLIAATLMMISPFFLTWAHRVLSDIPSTALAMASLYFLFVHIEDEAEKTWSAVLSGALLAASVLMRFVVLFMGICAIYFFLTRRLKLRSVLWYGAGFAALLAPYLIWAQIRQGGFLRPFLFAMAVGQGSEPVPNNLYYLEAAYVVAGPATILGLLGYVDALRRRQWEGWTSRDLPILIWFVTFALYLSTISHKEIRYILPAIPALFLLAGRGFSCVQGKRVVVVAAVAAAVAAFYPARHLSYFDGREDWVENMLAYSAETRPAARYVRENLAPGEVVYANHLWPVLAYYSKKKTVYLWPRDESFYRVYPQNLKQDGYVVFYKGIPTEPSLDWLDRNPEFHKVKEFGRIIIYAYKSAAQPAPAPKGDVQIDTASRKGPVVNPER